MKSIWPFWLAGLAVLLIVAFFPELSLWLPAVLKS
jgi:TRAP-type C4-dicarboxylate transport system permease large subunit